MVDKILISDIDNIEIYYHDENTSIYTKDNLEYEVHNNIIIFKEEYIFGDFYLKK